MTNEQFGDEEENLAHMELDKYLMDLSTMMEVDSGDEGEGGVSGTTSNSARIVPSGGLCEAPALGLTNSSGSRSNIQGKWKEQIEEEGGGQPVIVLGRCRPGFV